MARSDSALVSTPHSERATNYGPEAPVPVFQHQWELEQLLDLYRKRTPSNVLEVGTYHGGTLYHWLQDATFGTFITSLDSYAVGVDNRSKYPEWVPKGIYLNVIQGDSRDPETIEQVRNAGPFDWIFIDAGHYYSEVKSDWDNYGEMATGGAIVCFHDILTNPLHPEIEVEQLWREIQKLGYITQEFVADPDAAWGGIGVVYMP